MARRLPSDPLLEPGWELFHDPAAKEIGQPEDVIVDRMYASIRFYS
jgi:hypothetical protein